jgi:hypothetical protein
MKNKKYICSVCGWRGQRKECVLSHCVTKGAKPTHPLGRATPVLIDSDDKVEEADEPPADATELLRDLVTLIGRLAQKAQAPPEFAALGRRLTAALEPASDDADPVCFFALEPMPPKQELKRRLLDVFTCGVVPHIVWTHVHKHGTIRKCERARHLRTFGVHGWTTRPTSEVAHEALERMQTRLEKMWLSLRRDDPKAACVLRPAMLKFAARKTIYMDGDSEAFDLGSDVIASKDAVDKTMKDLSESLEEYARLL